MLILAFSGGTITGRLYLPTNSYVSGNETLNLHQIKGFFIIEQDNPYVETRFNMANNKHDKIINLADPENNHCQKSWTFRARDQLSAESHF